MPETTTSSTRFPLERHVALKQSVTVIVCYTLLYLVFFSPVLLSDRVLAPGDGIIYFLPNFGSARVLWDTSIWGGFPAVGDSQLMTWYPPAIFFSLFGASGYQAFILSGYVLASSFTFGFVFTLTGSRLAATVSGCVYGMCAFMIAHVGHAAVIHTAAWLPLVIWSLWKLNLERVSRLWFVTAVLSVAFAALAGHPQIFFYILSTAGAFVLVTGRHALFGRWRYYLICALVVVLGCGLAALQLWPTAELAGLSWRAALDFKEFVAYELPLRQVPMLLFPLLYGGSPGSFYQTGYFGAWPSSVDGWGASELSGYVGLVTLVLAAVGFVSQRRTTQARFWLGVFVVALLLTLGDSTPLARLVYYLPVLNKFRVPARHFVELTFAAGVLAGLGVSALQKGQASHLLLRRTLLVAAAVLIACLVSLLLFANKINELAIQFAGHRISLKPWSNPAIGLPLIVFCIVAATLVYWKGAPYSRARSALVLLALLIDLATFGWFYEWHYRSPYKAYLNIPAAAAAYRNEINSSQQRLLPVRGGTGRVSEIPPNLSKLWHVPSTSGYGPFIISRLSRLLTMPPHGSVDESWRDPANQGLDVLATRYVLVPPEEILPPTTKDDQGTSWTTSDFAADLGPGCNPANSSTYKIDLPGLPRVATVAVVGALACSVQIPDGQDVLQVTMIGENDSSVMQKFQAGRDFSEWAYDCSDVTPTMQHHRATIFRNYPVQRGTIKCEGHQYVARGQLNVGRPGGFQVKRLELRWIGPPGTFALKKITLLDDTGASLPLNPVAGSLGDAARWRKVGEINATNSGYGLSVKSEDIGAGVVFENLRARPRAWLVSEVLTLPEEDVFNAIRTSRLPDGRPFDSARTALVETVFALKPGQVDAQDKAQVISVAPTSMEVHVSSAAPAFLITSDVFYPGWTATVDGSPATIYQTDYALRGVAVSSGAHVVRFQFNPRTFYYGLVVSGVSLLLLLGFVFLRSRFLGAGSHSV